MTLSVDIVKKQDTQNIHSDLTALEPLLPFEIVYSDICGPFPTSHDGSKYFATFTDDFTRFTWTFHLKYRDEIYEVYQKIQTYGENSL